MARTKSELSELVVRKKRPSKQLQHFKVDAVLKFDLTFHSSLDPCNLKFCLNRVNFYNFAVNQTDAV